MREKEAFFLARKETSRALEKGRDAWLRQSSWSVDGLDPKKVPDLALAVKLLHPGGHGTGRARKNRLEEREKLRQKRIKKNRREKRAVWGDQDFGCPVSLSKEMRKGRKAGYRKGGTR